jgi:dolichol-phosphate mannosyltransferase
MAKAEKILAFVPEEGKIGKVLDGFPHGEIDEILVVNDGSTDNTPEEAKGYNITLIDHPVRKGAGGAIKTAVKYAIDNNYNIVVLLAGNGKDDPKEISRLLRPILEEGFDYVQGSRFLKGGGYDNLPLFRFIMIKSFSFIFWVLTGFRGTDVTNGFRAYRLSIFDHKDIHIWQDWLDTYELEYYIHYKVLKLGYKVKEVPVSKIYPGERGVKYSKIRPFADWWRMISPLVYLTLRIRN